jgi:DNA modification methylase
MKMTTTLSTSRSSAVAATWPPTGIDPYYSDDSVCIIHGDCREILPHLPKVDAVVTSPPYNTLGSLLRKASGLWSQSDSGFAWTESVRNDGYHDDMPEDEYQADQIRIFESIRCKESASLFYNHQLRWRDGICLHPIQWFTPKDWRLRSEIIWDRGGGLMFNSRMFCRFDERILWMVRGDNWKWNREFTGYGTIWRIQKMQRRAGKEHPVEYPIRIPKRCIRAATEIGDLILDPFMGSGTTLRAAKDLRRKAIGIEIEEKYCEIAAKRMQQEVFDFEGSTR